jgi:cobyrinic acid a,c-diamide synthase
MSPASALLIAAPRSGAGKTTLTAGLIAAFARRGLRVRAAKCGPDYIDPAFHAAASGAPCLNLDSWAMPPALLAATLQEAAADADLLLIESAVGLFDGAPGAVPCRGSAAEIALAFNLPVLLVLDVGGQAQSAAAMAHGFATFDPRLDLTGVVLNRVGSARHRASIEQVMAPLGISVLGALPREESVHLPERHLGLKQAREHDDVGAYLYALADLVTRHCDLAAILKLARPLAVMAAPMTALSPPGQRIALAEDAAFTFVYPHLVSGWRRAGAEVVPFSPLADEPPPEACDSCWLPGGYPELHAGKLAQAARFKSGLARFAASRPVHGECGGYMVLGEGLEDAGGVTHLMAGLLSHATSFAARRLHLGYRSARLLGPCALGPAGTELRGHEFHYASLVAPGRDDSLAALFDAEGNALGPMGGRRGHVSGSFFHVIAGAAEPRSSGVLTPELAAEA